eukprot:1070047-Heterocapsa_arctica.AAC.1
MSSFRWWAASGTRTLTHDCRSRISWSPRPGLTISMPLQRHRSRDTPHRSRARNCRGAYGTEVVRKPLNAFGSMP